MSNEKQELVPAGALWRYTSQTGKKMMQGEIELDGKKVRVIGFFKLPKTDPEGNVIPADPNVPDNRPDVKIYLSNEKPQAAPAPVVAKTVVKPVVAKPVQKPVVKAPVAPVQEEDPLL